jgi:DNA-binding transcriptional ArsR family regulator
MSTYEPPIRTYLIRDRATLKLIADPLRAQIYEALSPAPLTIKQVAARLGIAPSKLYYHINQMEEARLLRVVETRTVANMIEKLYWVVAENLEVDETLLVFTPETPSEDKQMLRALLASTLDTTREDILDSIQARELALNQGAPAQLRQLILTRQVARIPEARAEEFRQRLKALLAEFEQWGRDEQQNPNRDTLTYGLLLGFYPKFYYPDDAEAT